MTVRERAAITELARAVASEHLRTGKQMAPAYQLYLLLETQSLFREVDNDLQAELEAQGYAPGTRVGKA